MEYECFERMKVQTLLMRMFGTCMLVKVCKRSTYCVYRPTLALSVTSLRLFNIVGNKSMTYQMSVTWQNIPEIRNVVVRGQVCDKSKQWRLTFTAQPCAIHWAVVHVLRANKIVHVNGTAGVTSDSSLVFLFVPRIPWCLVQRIRARAALTLRSLEQNLIIFY